MNLQTHILLCCPYCERQMEVERIEHDYPEAVRVEVRCEQCDDGGFAEVMHFDVAGKHITRDPNFSSKRHEDWQHLKQYGYAPGDYMNRCHRCGAVYIMDKRAITCLACAQSMHNTNSPTAESG